jgi:hypothetical protein
VPETETGGSSQYFMMVGVVSFVFVVLKKNQKPKNFFNDFSSCDLVKGL